MMRPFMPPPLASLGLGGDANGHGADQRQVQAAFQAGRAQGLEEGRAQGRKEGLAAGQQQGLSQAEAHSAERERQGLGALNNALASLLANREADRQAMDAAGRAALAALLDLVAPTLLASGLGAELQAVLAEALERRGTDKVTLRAHPKTLAALPPGAAAAPAEQLHLLPDTAMAPGTAEASWQGGGLLFNPPALLARMRAILAAPPQPLPLQEPQT